jgi:hypothetical protein
MEVRLFGTKVSGTMDSLKEEEQEYNKIELLKAISRKVNPMAFADQFVLIICKRSAILS